MDFTFLGTSAGVPTKQRNVTALAVSFEGRKDWILIDCGEGTQQQLLHVPHSLANLAAICITHVHGDHCYGLPGILASAGMAGRKDPLTVICPKPLHQWIELTLANTDCFTPFEINLVDVEQLQSGTLEPQKYGGFTIECLPLSHRVPCYAYRLTEANPEHRLDTDKLEREGIARGPAWGLLHKGERVQLDDGRELSGQDYWLTDAKPRVAIVGGDNDEPELLAEAAKGCDLIIHEATYTQAISDRVGPAPMHSSAKQVAEFASEVAVQNLILTHFSARYFRDAGFVDMASSNESLNPAEFDPEHSLASVWFEAREYYRGNLFLAEDFRSFRLKREGQVVKLNKY